MHEYVVRSSWTCKTCILCSGIALVSMLVSIACVWTYLVKCETLSGADAACQTERLPSLKIQKKCYETTVN